MRTWGYALEAGGSRAQNLGMSTRIGIIGTGNMGRATRYRKEIVRRHPLIGARNYDSVVDLPNRVIASM
jgi:hypothetical protein